uniref:Secreted protein n=1 Tax=Kalanchoe fedtschenkoi TaxID=63787 RepID=A0A7N0SWE8_KALFE
MVVEWQLLLQLLLLVDAAAAGVVGAEFEIKREVGRRGGGAAWKLVFAFEPRSDLASPSYGSAASFGVSNMPSQTLVFFHGSRISVAYRPHWRFLTPCSAPLGPTAP